MCPDSALVQEWKVSFERAEAASAALRVGYSNAANKFQACCLTDSVSNATEPSLAAEQTRLQDDGRSVRQRDAYQETGVSDYDGPAYDCICLLSSQMPSAAKLKPL